MKKFLLILTIIISIFVWSGGVIIGWELAEITAKKERHFIISYTALDVDDNGIRYNGVIEFSVNNKFLSRKDAIEMIEKQDSTLKCIVITGLTELNEKDIEAWRNGIK